MNNELSQSSFHKSNEYSMIKKSFYNNRTSLYRPEDIQIIKLACFENEQINVLFNDNTTMIIYPYFSK